MQPPDLCAKCHQKAQEAQGYLFCPNCEAWLCPKCHNPLPPRSTYCRQCDPRRSIRVPLNPPPKVTTVPQRGAYSGHIRQNVPSQQTQPDAHRQYKCNKCLQAVNTQRGPCPKCGDNSTRLPITSPLPLKGSPPEKKSLTPETGHSSPSQKTQAVVNHQYSDTHAAGYTPKPQETTYSAKGHEQKIESRDYANQHDLLKSESRLHKFSETVSQQRPLLLWLLLIIVVIAAVTIIYNKFGPDIMSIYRQHASQTSPATPPPSISNTTQTYSLNTGVLPEAGGEIRIIPPSSSSGMFESGSQITLTAIPGNCYTFDRWEIENTPKWEQPVTINMDSDKNVTAHFKVKDTTPPAISSIEVPNVTELCATITWKTDSPTTGQVEYGETDAYGLNGPADENLTTEHNVRLIGLKPDTIYHFRAISEDACQQQAKSTDQRFETTYPEPARVGNRAPDFMLRQINGNPTVVLSDFQGKKRVLLNLWATGCTGCVLEMPYIQAIHEKYADLAVMTVCLDKDVDKISNFVEKHPELTFPILVNQPSITATSYNIRLMPTTFFINSNGIIKEIHTGSFASAEQIEGSLKYIN